MLSLLLMVAAPRSTAADGTDAKPGEGDADGIAPRVVACTLCHGKEGRATADGYFPRIAGKPAGYLYNQLVNFREGRRQYAPMTYLVDHLSDAYLLEIAQHFASLDLPYPPPQGAAGTSAAVLVRGESLVRQGDAARDVPACSRCHGNALTGRQPSIPGLLGLPRDYLQAQLGAWQTKQRHAHAPDCMATVVERLAPGDIVAVANWLAAQPVPAGAAAAPASRDPLPIRCGSSTLVGESR